MDTVTSFSLSIYIWIEHSDIKPYLHTSSNSNNHYIFVFRSWIGAVLRLSWWVMKHLWCVMSYLRHDQPTDEKHTIISQPFNCSVAIYIATLYTSMLWLAMPTYTYIYINYIPTYHWAPIQGLSVCWTLFPHISDQSGSQCLFPHISDQSGSRCRFPHISDQSGSRCRFPHISDQSGSRCRFPIISDY